MFTCFQYLFQTLSLPGSKKKKKKRKKRKDGEGSSESSEEEEEEEMSERQKKKMSIKETKRSLPVYPFRQGLLDAVAEHQVLIIEGNGGHNFHPIYDEWQCCIFPMVWC